MHQDLEISMNQFDGLILGWVTNATRLLSNPRSNFVSQSIWPCPMRVGSKPCSAQPQRPSPLWIP